MSMAATALDASQLLLSTFAQPPWSCRRRGALRPAEEAARWRAVRGAPPHLLRAPAPIAKPQRPRRTYLRAYPAGPKYPTDTRPKVTGVTGQCLPQRHALAGRPPELVVPVAALRAEAARPAHEPAISPTEVEAAQRRGAERRAQQVEAAATGSGRAMNDAQEPDAAARRHRRGYRPRKTIPYDLSRMRLPPH